MSLNKRWIRRIITSCICTTKFPFRPKLCQLCSVTWVYCATLPGPWKKNPVLSVDRVQVYITMEDTWSGWQDNGNIMDPGQSIHHIATSEVTDQQKTKFPSPGPDTWGYSTVWYFILPITHTTETKKVRRVSYSRNPISSLRVSAALSNERFRCFHQFRRDYLTCSLEQVTIS